ncbi:uncharacterized protein BDZ99DRAFT_518772 [Mytilinidion resinicola]|uniref:FabD/lysophospholipase-like protein n=1 Tax=Mytilinidion resinicola TaxID=574789 RepID=A0A6A6YRW2_9PEZI|nr:uncharacterized protein BDZ99DRAFT_518772 [Mytilinidion resinicola]KAF2811511.1 hypothetical protein BDZ99DRAFT_518772 [Mytilinidion resinicola]
MSFTGPIRRGVPGQAVLNDSEGERLLTFDGGVRSYSSVLLMLELMNKIARYENVFENEFTSYPRNFNAANLHPCHYFDKTYGTSTGGISTIALSRLRMAVPETVDAFRQLLTEMYTNTRSAIPLATKYHHKPFERALRQMIQTYCKQHQPGLCYREEKFPWGSAEEHDTDSLCQTLCLTARSNDGAATGIDDEAYLLRTYDHRYSLETPNFVTLYNDGGR